jgi:hypothetical protein
MGLYRAVEVFIFYTLNEINLLLYPAAYYLIKIILETSAFFVFYKYSTSQRKRTSAVVVTVFVVFVLKESPPEA